VLSQAGQEVDAIWDSITQFFRPKCILTVITYTDAAMQSDGNQYFIAISHRTNADGASAAERLATHGCNPPDCRHSRSARHSPSQERVCALDEDRLMSSMPLRRTRRSANYDLACLVGEEYAANCVCA
jgi:hypothetical protein